MNWFSVQMNCINIMGSIRDLIEWIINFLTDTSMFENLNNQIVGNAIISAIKSTAITLCVLFFLIDFFQKSLHLQWVTWENIMLFFMKLFIAKIAVENAGKILEMIQKGFSSIISSSGLDSRSYPMSIFPSGDATGDCEYFLEGEDLINAKSADVTWYIDINLNAGFANIGITIIGLIMKLVFVMTAILVIARIFELLVYTAIAPIPLATLSCEGLQDVGKGFLKSYAAVCLQAVIIVLMMVIYGVLFTSKGILHLNFIPQSITALLFTFIFGAGVMQSGSWAKRICGAM